MTDFLLTLRNYYIVEILFIAAVLLILIDYFFPVDFAAYIGYFCFAAGIFFVAPFGMAFSLVLGVATFAILLLLHRVLFSRYLTNATDRPGAE